MNLFTSPMYNFAIMCPYKITYLLHSISILPSKYILRWKYILRNKNQLNLVTEYSNGSLLWQLKPFLCWGWGGGGCGVFKAAYRYE